MRIVITSLDSKKSAKRLAKKLVNAKKAACVSILKANSIYVWSGKICDEKERILLIKTDLKFKKIAKFIKKYHSYELPEIISFKSDNISKDYKKWIKRKLYETLSNKSE